MARQWSINGRFTTQPVTGVQRYAHEIIRALDRWLTAGHPLAQGLQLELLVPPGAVNLPRLTAISVRTVGRMGGHAWEQGELALHARGGLISLCNTGPLVVRRQVVCMHDVNTRSHPESYSLPFRMAYRALLPGLGRVARRIVTVSRHSSDQLVRFRVTSPEKISIIANGHEHALGWTPRHSAATRAAAGPDTIVILGSPAPHKNVGLVLALSQRLAAAGLRIAVAGAADARVFQNGGLGGAGDNVVWLGRLSDEELAALLRDSLCLAFPSLAEGFGIPPLEAMTLGCPVVVSDRASLPEVCGDAALYASPDDPEAWYASLVRLHRDAKLRADLAVRGEARARRFSWRASAELYLQVMAQLDGISLRPTAPSGAASLSQIS
jgi:glycosyltransferase involved in cell wall biosynthesis